MARTRDRRNRLREPRRHATRSDQRIHFTFIGMICNHPWIQALLPQVLIVPERALGWLDWEQIMSELPDNVYVLRQPSMWVNTNIYAKVFKLFRKISASIRSKGISKCCYSLMLLADTFLRQPCRRWETTITGSFCCPRSLRGCCSPWMSRCLSWLSASCGRGSVYRAWLKTVAISPSWV